VLDIYMDLYDWAALLVNLLSQVAQDESRSELGSARFFSVPALQRDQKDLTRTGNGGNPDTSRAEPISKFFKGMQKFCLAKNCEKQKTLFHYFLAAKKILAKFV
jgi:hypothetical protein